MGSVRAVMVAGGRQYRVSVGDIIDVEQYKVGIGEKITLRPVLFFQDEAGVVVETDQLKEAKVVAEVLEQGRAKKIIVFKKKRRKNYRRTQGHRQHFTRLKIAEIVKE